MVEATDAKPIVLDLSGLDFIDSTGVQLVIMADARSRADSNRLSLLRPSHGVFRVFVICGVADRLPFAHRDERGTRHRSVGGAPSPHFE